VKRPEFTILLHPDLPIVVTATARGLRIGMEQEGLDEPVSAGPCTMSASGSTGPVLVRSGCVEPVGLRGGGQQRVFLNGPFSTLQREGTALTDPHSNRPPGSVTGSAQLDAPRHRAGEESLGARIGRCPVLPAPPRSEAPVTTMGRSGQSRNPRRAAQPDNEVVR